MKPTRSLCQMVPQYRKKLSRVTNMSEISPKPAPLYSPHTPPSKQRDYIFASLLLTDIACLAMLSIPQLMPTAPAEKYIT